jgi:hypothetical protein
VLRFAMPAAGAGYHAALGCAHIGISAEGWQQAMAVMGASAPPRPGLAWCSLPRARRRTRLAAGVRSPDR